MRHTLLVRIALCGQIVLGSACRDASDDPLLTPDELDQAPECEAVEPTPPEPLRWRRHRTWMRGLSQALELDVEATCVELGDISCSELHFVPLGGNDPFAPGMYSPIPMPMATTPPAIERVALTACAQRIALDQREGEPVILTSSAPSLTPDDTLALTRDLFRRILRRDPSESEASLVASLSDGRAPDEFAVLACVAIATTTEHVLH